MDDDLTDDGLLADDPFDDQDGTISDSDDPLDHMAENFGLDAEPGTKGVKASGAGLSGDIGGHTARSSSDPDTYRDAPDSGARTGGAGV
ncbi:MAG TPA: hypothetical protein VGB53_15745 [Rubricoccaceae bacterium]|jgi:hypothetical protein